jgi:hypothetical protein
VRARVAPGPSAFDHTPAPTTAATFQPRRPGQTPTTLHPLSASAKKLGGVRWNATRPVASRIEKDDDATIVAQVHEARTLFGLDADEVERQQPKRSLVWLTGLKTALYQPRQSADADRRHEEGEQGNQDSKPNL